MLTSLLFATAALATPLQDSKRWIESDWSLVETWSGSDFFSHWDFFNDTDPTEGTVIYVNESTAWADGLIEVNSNNHAIMRVETTKNVEEAGGRKSIRLSGNLTFTGGLVIMDSYHMPTGCATWPAWWSLGNSESGFGGADLDWPYHGEIDIIENKVSIHSGPGCMIQDTINMDQTGWLQVGLSYNASSCFALEGGDASCGVLNEEPNHSFGEPFNRNGGGVYALLWTSGTIQVFFFPRQSIPDDIKHDHPDPLTWGKPVANYTSDACSPFEYFNDHYSVFDTTLCGSWAGNITSWASTLDGQTQACAYTTKYDNCTKYVLENGEKFKEAYWEIGYVKYFNSTRL